MRKVISLLLVLVLCLGLCACDNKQEQENSVAKEQAEALSFREQVIGCFEYRAGWSKLGTEIEFIGDGTCLIKGEELKWEVMTKVKMGSVPRDFVNVYRDGSLAYEAHVNIWDDGTISLVIYEGNADGNEVLPDGTYVKMEGHTHEH